MKLTKILKFIFIIIFLILLTSYFSFSAETMSVAVYGNYICLGDDGFRIINASDPSTPYHVGYLPFTEKIFGITISNDLAFITIRNSGFHVIDISNVSQPVQIGFNNTGNYSRKPKISNNYAFVPAQTNGLRILDISIPNSPTEVSSYENFDDGYPWSVDVKGNYAYVATNQKLIILDISNISNPIKISEFNPSSTTTDNYVSVKDNYAYFTASNTGLRIIDISDPTNPVEISSLTVGSTSYKVTTFGTNCYVANDHWGYDSGLYSINISDPLNPTQDWLFHPSVNSVPTDLDVDESYIYLAYYTSGLFIVDKNGNQISNYKYEEDPSLPVELTNFEANIYNDGILLTWITQSEVNNLGFEIFKSINNFDNYNLLTSFKTNHSLLGNGNSSERKLYSFYDDNVDDGLLYLS